MARDGSSMKSGTPHVIMIVAMLLTGLGSASLVAAGNAEATGEDTRLPVIAIAPADLGSRATLAIDTCPGNELASRWQQPIEPQDAAESPDHDISLVDDDGATELGEVTCGKPSWGSMCSEICAESGVACPPSTKHPKKDDGGRGQLFKCCGCKGNQRCWYIHDNGDVCVWFKHNWLPQFALCGYQGGN